MAVLIWNFKQTDYTQPLDRQLLKCFYFLTIMSLQCLNHAFYEDLRPSQ